MTDVFEKLLEMSLTAAVVIVVVLAIRLLLRKAPKKYSYILWAVAAFRLVCPVSFRAVFSIFRLAQVVERVEITQTGTPAPVPVASAMPSAAVDAVPPEINVEAPPVVTITPVVNTANLLERAMEIAAILWLVGLAALLIYGVVSYARLRRAMAKAVLLEGNVYQSERVRSPFILGFAGPRIYLPFGLSEEQQRYVLAHERYHIRRLDHMVRPAAFLILAVHWFNPLVWAAYYLMGRDMEMSCDEKVLGGADNIRKAYSITLLSFAANRRFPSPSPLAFGETGVQGRIKNALNWKKPRLWVTVIAVVVCAAVIAVCAANPSRPEEAPEGEVLWQPGWYHSVECLYMSPLSSIIPLDGDSGYDYRIDEEQVILRHHGATYNVQLMEAMSPWETLTEEGWLALCGGDPGNFSERLWETIGQYERPMIRQMDGGYCLMDMDGELWIGRQSSHPDGTLYWWSIYRLATLEEEKIPPDDDPAPMWSGTKPLTQWSADLTHDGTDEIISVDQIVENRFGVFVYNGDGRLLWMEEAGLAQAERNGIWLYEADGKQYLMTWNPSTSQGYLTAEYRIFSLSEEGAETGEISSGIIFGGSSDSELARLDIDALRRFEAEVNGRLQSASVLLSTSGGLLTYDRPESMTLHRIWNANVEGWEERIRQARGESQTETLAE